MALWDTIKEIRVKANLTQRQFADIIGCTAMHVSLSERPYSESRGTMSPAFLREIAEKFSTTEEERLALEKQLLIERGILQFAKLKIEDEVREKLEKIFQSRKKSPRRCIKDIGGEK